MWGELGSGQGDRHFGLVLHRRNGASLCCEQVITIRLTNHDLTDIDKEIAGKYFKKKKRDATVRSHPSFSLPASC
jgi:hypothetical protein